MLRASDAFNEEHLEKTAKRLLKKVDKELDEEVVEDELYYQTARNRKELHTTEAYKNYSARILKALDSESQEIRKEAAKKGKRVNIQNFNFFEKALSDEDWKVRSNAAQALYFYEGPPDAYKLFEKALADTNPLNRRDAVKALIAYKGPDTYKLFGKALSDESEYVRQDAASVIVVNFKSKKSELKLKMIPIFLELLKNKDPQIRKEISNLFKNSILT